jgi:hypothetical protein
VYCDRVRRATSVGRLAAGDYREDSIGGALVLSADPSALADSALHIDNNFDEHQIRPGATGRKHWLFVGTMLAGQWAAAIMSLIQLAKLNGHDLYVYVPTRSRS